MDLLGFHIGGGDTEVPNQGNGCNGSARSTPVYFKGGESECMEH